MYEIKKETKVITRDELDVYSRQMVYANIFEVAGGTNARYKAKETSDEPITYLSFKDLGSTCWKAIIDGKQVEYPSQIELIFHGDGELNNIISAFEFLLKVLKEEGRKGSD